MDLAGKIIGAVAIVVIMITLISMTPTVVEQVQIAISNSTEPATEWNFTGASGARSLLGLVPFIWVASILISGAVGMFELAKTTGKGKIGI